MKRLFIIWFILLSSQPLYALDSIVVRGLFYGKALLEIDGKSRVMREGERSAEGVMLIHADSRGAEIELNGERQTLGLGSTISNQFSAATKREISIPRDADGMYRIGGTVNGRGVEFLVDTGASSVAMSGHQAQRLGIDYRGVGRRVYTETASAVVPAYNIVLDKVEVGPIVLFNVDAVILEGSKPSMPLLGLSFLRRLELTQSGNIIKLSK